MSHKRSHSHLPLSLLALIATPSNLAMAQSPPELVVTATRLPIPVDRATAPTTVITAEELARHADQTLPDALRRVPGLGVVTSGGPGGNTSVFARGSNSDHVLVLLDGQPLNDPSLAAAAFNFGDDLLTGVERIEVVRGPLSTLYGSSAMGGVVNLVTAAGADTKARAGVDVGFGSDGTRRGGATLRGTHDRFDYGLALEGFETAGDNATPARFASRNIGESDGFENLTGSAKGVLRLEGGRLEALLRARTSQFDLDSVPDDDPNYTGESDTLAWQLAGTADLFAKVWETRLSVGQTRYERSFANAPDAASVDRSDDSYDGVRSQIDWQNTLTLPVTGGIDEAALLFGATWSEDTVTLDTRSVSAFGPFDQSVDADASTLAGFAQLQGRFAGRLDVTAAVRHESPDDYGDRTTWRLGTVLALPELSARLRASAGSAFKAPSLYDRYGTNNFGYRGNPGLKAETSTGWEAGIAVDLPPTLGAATLSALWFRSDVDNLITFQFNPDFTSTVVNRAKADIQGVETEFTVSPASWLSLRAAWTWTDARDGVTDARLLRRPEHAVSVDADIAPLPEITLTPELQYVGRRIDVAYSDAGDFLGNRAVDGYWTVNIAAVWEATQAWSLYAKGGNVLDRTVENPNGFARPDRGLLVGARGRF